MIIINEIMVFFFYTSLFFFFFFFFFFTQIINCIYFFFINCIYCIVLIVYIVLARTCFNERFSLLNVAWLNKVLLLLLLLLLCRKILDRPMKSVSVSVTCNNSPWF